MKQLVLVTMLIAAAMAVCTDGAFAWDKTTSTTNSSPGFFSLGGLGCYGPSMCSTKVTITTTGRSTVTTNGDGTLTYSFDYESFNEKNKEYYKDRKTFVMEKETPVNAEDIEALHLPPGTVYDPGESPIKWVKGMMVVTIGIH